MYSNAITNNNDSKYINMNYGDNDDGDMEEVDMLG